VRTSFSSLDDTIVALATPPGRSALALLRLSGRDARSIAARVAPGLPDPIPERRPVLVDVFDEAGAAVDRGLVTFFPGPRSATGEDVVEISLHGAPVVAGAILDALCAAGGRPARAGEFTERAFLLGKVDLVQAEAVRELIDARTPAAARASARRLDGELSGRLAAVREALQRVATEIAGTLDFAEDVGEELPAETAARIAWAQTELASLCAGSSRGALLTEGARVVILGRPNAGKSTLFNALVGSERAIVTEVAGTTRDTLHASLDVVGVPVEIVDTAGLRATDDPVESIGVGRAREAGAAADAIVYVFDAGAGWTSEDAAALSELEAAASASASVSTSSSDAVAAIGVLVVANKIDTIDGPPGGPAGRVVLALHGRGPGAGDVLRREIAARLGAGPALETLSAIVGSARQRDAVRRAAAAVRAASESLSAKESPEYLAARVGEALDALADLFGETTPEEILRRLFAEFCIGK
jgi:tRNA modification GTPase